MKTHNPIFLFTVLLVLITVSCKETEPLVKDPLITKSNITINPDSLKLSDLGGTDTLTVSMKGSKWVASSNQSWCTLSKATSSLPINQVIITIPANTSKSVRNAKLTFIMDQKDTAFVYITQEAQGIYPNYSNPVASNATGMSSTAVDIAKKIKVGLNIGNTLEAIGSETAWGNPLITNDLIKFAKQSGFNAIRLPCSWNQYSDSSTAKISASWLTRVKQVVQYCVDNNLYVILNIHWDGGWLENNCTTVKQVANNAKQKAFWEQIAVTLRDFDEHVLFASANEPNVADATQMGVLLSYHQTFINAVRSTGGKNAYRVLVVQGPSTDIETTNKLMTLLPADKIPNKMMAEVHYYTPWNFSGMTKDETWGNMAYYWGANFHSTTDVAHNATWGEEATVDANFGLMKKQFVDKGIPVVIGEFGAIRRDNLTGDALKLHLASRAYYFKYVTKQAIANGLLPFFWDTGGLLDRTKNTVLDQQSLDALIQGANQ